MAEPEFAPSTGWWYIRYRTGRGTRAKKTLLKDPRWSKGGAWPPEGKRPRPPAEVLILARPFQDLDTQARMGREVKIPRATPVGQFLGAYRASYKATRKPRSFVVLRRSVDHFLTFCRERKLVNVEAVSRADVRAYMEARRAAGAKFNTVRSEKGMLGAAWTRAVQDEILPMNPWSGVPVPGDDDSEPTPSWTEAEVTAIAAKLDGWARDAFVVGVNCGFRVNALLNLQWRDVRWSVPRRQLGLLVCRKELSKNKREYAVPLFPAAHDVLARRFGGATATKPRDLIFPGHAAGKGMARGSFAKLLIRAIEAAGVEYHGHECHAMRATFATLAGAKGVNPRALQAWLSHSSLRMTDRYVGHSTEADEREAGKLADGIGAGEGDPVNPPRPPDP
jgi:integrase